MDKFDEREMQVRRNLMVRLGLRLANWSGALVPRSNFCAGWNRSGLGTGRYERPLLYQDLMPAAVHSGFGGLPAQERFCKAANIALVIVERRKQFLVGGQVPLGAPLQITSK